MKTNIDILVEAFGSQRVLAHYLEISHPSISYWRKQDHVPSRYNDRLMTAAEKFLADHPEEQAYAFMSKVENCLAVACDHCGHDL